MTGPLVFPPMPRPLPALVADPDAIRSCASALLAASAQVDDLGSFVASTARVPDWEGMASTAYHRGTEPLGARADAMSLALRGVARRVDAHAEEMAALLRAHDVLDGERVAILTTITDLRALAALTGPDEVAAVQAACDDCARRVRGYEADLDAWRPRVAAEEEAMAHAFTRVLALDQVDRRYAGVPDPADAALASLPADGSSAAVHAWWTSLGRDAQLALIAASPGSIGNRDGVAPWARDAANSVALDRDLADWGRLEELGELSSREEAWLANARSARDALDLARHGIDPATGDPVTAQLYLYDPAAFDDDGAVAVSVGDLGAARDVAVTVPGFGTDARSAPFQADRALDLYEASRSVDGTDPVSTMFWIGYDAPDNVPWTGEGWDAGGVVAEDLAEAGGGRLADLLDGLRDSRDGDPAHLTVIGVSYGSTTVGHAAHDAGVPVDDLVLVGSPGAGGETDTAADLGVATGHVWAGSSSRDPIADLGNHGAVHLESLGGAGLGDDPAEDDFGATRFRAESTTRGDHAGLAGLGEHLKYFDHDSESLFNLSRIVTGHHDQVTTAEPVHDPWWGAPQDPEWDREPTSPDTLDEP